MAAQESNTSDIITEHFLSCGIKDPLDYLAKGLDCSPRTVRRYLKILDRDPELLKQIYTDKIVELSEIAMESRPIENEVKKIFPWSKS